MIAGAFISDRGGLYLPTCRATAAKHIYGVGACCVVDDTQHELGMAGAVRSAWQWALSVGADFLFHVEEDFVFRSNVDVTHLAAILERQPHLAQLVLKRQPWNAVEIKAGGIIEANPDAYTDTAKGWVEHDEIFSLNPCLIPRRVLELGWPDGNEAEFTLMCQEAGYRFAFYGAAHDHPRVQHIGYKRGDGWRL